MFKRKSKFIKVFLAIFLSSFLSFPGGTYGRPIERTMLWDSSAGHDHDGATKGKKIDAGDVVNTPSGDIVATDIQAAVTELDVEKIPESDKGTAGGVATLDGSAKILALQLPAIAITDVNVCASQVCQLALTAEEGDVCIRSDENKSYIHNGGLADDMTDWSQLLATGIVTSVQSLTGDLTFDHDDWNNMTADNHHDDLSNGYDITPNSVDTGSIDSDAGITTTGTSNTNLFQGTVTAKSFPHFLGYVGGWLQWGTGDSALDTGIYRSGINELTTGKLILNTITVTNNLYAEDGMTTTTGNVNDNVVNAKVTGDANIRWSILAGGWMQWGDGTAALDSDIFREGADSLKTGGDWHIGDDLFFDTNGGAIVFGASQDVNLYWSASNVLKTDDAFQVGDRVALMLGGYIDTIAATSGSWTFLTGIDGDAVDSFGIEADGRHLWSNGTDAWDTTLERTGVNTLTASGNLNLDGGTLVLNTDTNLYRAGANQLKTDDDFIVAGGNLYLGADVQLIRSAANILSSPDQYNITGTSYFNRTATASTNFIMAARVSGDGANRFYIDVAGSHAWGTGGAGTDTNLYRSGVGELKTDGDLVVAGDDIYFGTAKDTRLYRFSANLLVTPDSFGAAAVAASGTAASFTHSATTKTMMVGPIDAIVSDTNPANIDDDPFRIIPSASDSAYDVAWVSFRLPHGATITRLDSYGYTSANAANECLTELYRHGQATSSISGAMASCSYFNSQTSCNDTTISDATVDGEYYYLLKISVKVTTSTVNTRWYHSKITYTTTNLSMTQ